MRIDVTPVLVADLGVEGGRMPVYAHVIDHPDARILVDTGIRERHPLVDDLDPRPRPVEEWGVDLAGIDLVVNTHLHFDHCGNNHRFTGIPIHVQQRELDDALSEHSHTIRDWVDVPGVDYVADDGAVELLPGVRLVPAPGHTRGSQVVVLDSGAQPTVIAGDTAVFSRDLDAPQTEGQRLVVDLQPERVWLAHVREPWRSSTVHD